MVLRYISSFQREQTAFAPVKSTFDYSAAVNRQKLSSQLLATLFTSMAAIGARFQGAVEDADRLFNQARMNIMQQYDRVDPYVIATHYLQSAHAELKGAFFPTLIFAFPMSLTGFCSSLNKGDIEKAMISGTLAENMAELWIRKGNPCEAGVDAHSVLLSCIARKREYVADEFVKVLSHSNDMQAQNGPIFISWVLDLSLRC